MRLRIFGILMVLAALGGAIALVVCQPGAGASEKAISDARALASGGQPAAAQKLLQDFLAAHPDDAAVPLALANLIDSQGHSVDAQKVLQASLKLHPNDAATNEALADMVVKSLGDIAYPSVQKLYEAAFRADPRRVSAAVALAKTNLAQNQVGKAAALLEQALAVNNRSAEAHLMLAKILTLQHQYDKAGIHFNAATALQPENAEAYCLWGLMLIDQGKPDVAERVLRKAIEIDDSSPAYHMHLGRALRAQGQFKQAMDEFQEALNRDIKYEPVYIELANSMLQVHREESAEKFLRDVLVINPHDIDALIGIAKLVSNTTDPLRRNLWQAAKYLGQAVEETHGRDISVLVAHARILAQLELFDQAAEEIDNALVLTAQVKLPPEQMELLMQYRQDYILASMPHDPADAGDSDDDFHMFDPLRDRFDSPYQPNLNFPMKAAWNEPATRPAARGDQ